MITKISVVVPTYRRPALLIRCLSALMKQLFYKEQYEIIIVSDGPDEETRAMVQLLLSESVPLINYFPLPERRGPAAARNAGWRAATGELVAFTDDDCIPDINWLPALWNAYKEHSFPAVAFTGKIIVPVSNRPTDYELNIAQLSVADFVTANCACSRQALLDVNGFDEQFTQAWREDSDLHFRLLKQNIPVCPVSQAVVTHPVRKEAWGVSLKEQKKSMFNALLYKKHPALYRERIQGQPPWNYYIVVLSFILVTTGLSVDSLLTTGIAFVAWITFTSSFILKRLKRSSRSASHVAEMILTSFLIPFLSIYWRLYGAWKYRVLFI